MALYWGRKILAGKRSLKKHYSTIAVNINISKQVIRMTGILRLKAIKLEYYLTGYQKCCSNTMYIFCLYFQPLQAYCIPWIILSQYKVYRVYFHGSMVLANDHLDFLNFEIWQQLETPTRKKTIIMKK